MLFERKDVFKLEWNALLGRYLIVLIEQYEVATFDSESECFLEATNYVNGSRAVYSMDSEGTELAVEGEEWNVSLVVGLPALRKRMLSLITTEFGIKDIYSASELAEQALANISA